MLKSLRKVFCYAGILIIVLLLSIIALSYYLLGTTAGIYTSLNLLNRFTVYEISAEKVSGRLLGKTELHNLQIKGTQMTFTGQSVLLHWHLEQLFNRALVVDAIVIQRAHLTVRRDDSKAAEKTTARPVKLRDIQLPVGVHIKRISAEQFTIHLPAKKAPSGQGNSNQNSVAAGKKPQAPATDSWTIDSFELGVDYNEHKGTIKRFFVKGHDVSMTMQGSIVTKGDYPLYLQSTTDYRSDVDGEQSIEANIVGELNKTLTFAFKGKGLGEFVLTGQVRDLFEQAEITSKLDLQRVAIPRLQRPGSSISGVMTSQIRFGQTINAKMTGKVNYQSPQTGQVVLDFVSQFNDKLIEVSDLSIALPMTRERLAGQGRFDLHSKALDLQLKSAQLHWPQVPATTDTMPLSLNDLSLQLSGQVDDYQLTLKTQVMQHAVGKLPIVLSAAGNLSALQQFSLQAMPNKQIVTIDGNVRWRPQVAYHMQLRASAIKAFRTLPNIDDLHLDIQGDDQHYRISGQSQLLSATIPNMLATIDMTGDVARLNGKINLKTLGGSIEIETKSIFSPWQVSARVRANHIELQRFYPNVTSDLNADIRLQAQRQQQGIVVSAAIQSLSGQLANYPVKGRGKVIFDQGQSMVNVDKLAVDLAGNRVEAAGILLLAPKTQQVRQNSHARVPFKANIDAKYLQRLLPGLSGALTAVVEVKGVLQKPVIMAALEAAQLQYHNDKVAQLNATVAIDTIRDRIDVKTTAKALTVREQVINALHIAIDGSLAEHHLDIAVAVPQGGNMPGVHLSADGGLDEHQQSWSGQLQQLAVVDSLAGKWQLSKPSALVLGKDYLRVTDLCLQQQQSYLCATGQMDGGKGQFDFTLKHLTTKIFARRLPPSFTVDAALSGRANVVLVDGAPEFDAQLTAEPGGRLAIATANAALTSDIQRFEVQGTLRNKRLQAELHSAFSQFGRLDLKTTVADIEQPSVDASITINNDDLSFISQLLPQLSDIRGKLKGNMQVTVGSAQSLKLSGRIGLAQARFNVPQVGAQIRDVSFELFAKGGGQLGFSGGAKAGAGQLVFSGGLHPLTRQGNIRIKGSTFKLVHTNDWQLVVNPDIEILLADAIKVRGEVLVPSALIVPSSSANKVSASSDVVIPQKSQKKPPESPVDIDVKIEFGDDVRVANADIETRLHGGIRLVMLPKLPLEATGVISVQTGELSVYGQRLAIERGRVIFAKGPLDDPALDIRATRSIDATDMTVGANILGTVSKPEISLFSTPGMPESSILSYLLFGRPPDRNSFDQSILLQTGGLLSANTVARKIRASIGLDVLNFAPTGVEVGKNISKKLYLSMKSNFFTAINRFLLKYRFNKTLNLDGEVGSEGDVSVDLIKVIETD